jgi:alkanesulfonate monooxygenase SsuD/methylene tetrahydromethanopterin reductase-like flavin-dependent oxidoreductase (luciferase family)
VRLACEIGDGLLPFFWSPTRWSAAYGDAIAGRPAGFDIAAIVDVAVGDDIDACRDALRPHFALYIGGMGAQGHNFYNDLVSRYGFEAEAHEIASLFLSGDRAGAARAVPDSLIDDLALLGPREHIAEQLEAWAASPVTTLIVNSNDPSTLSLLADLIG